MYGDTDTALDREIAVLERMLDQGCSSKNAAYQEKKEHVIEVAEERYNTVWAEYIERGIENMEYWAENDNDSHSSVQEASPSYIAYALEISHQEGINWNDNPDIFDIADAAQSYRQKQSEEGDN